MADNSTDVTLGSRSAQVWKFAPDGSRLETTPEDAAQAAIGSMPANAEAKRNPIGQAFDFVRDVANKGVSLAGQYDPLQAGQAALSKASGGAVPMPDMTHGGRVTEEQNQAAGDTVAKNIVPQTPAVAATMAALGPLSKLGLLKGAIASSAAGAGANAVAGEDAGQGAIEGAAGHVLPRAVAPALNWVSGIAGRVGGKMGMMTAEGQQHAGKILHAINEDVPELAAAAAGKGRSPSEQLLRIQDAAVGPKALGTMMDVSEKPIEKALPNAQFVIPKAPSASAPAAAAASPLTPAQQLYNGANPTVQAAIRKANPGIDFSQASAQGAAPETVGIGTALRELKNLKAEAREVYSPDNPLASVETTKRAKQLEDDIYGVVNAHDPDMAAAWKMAMDKYGKGLDYLGLANKTIQGQSAAHSPVDIAGSVNHILQNARDFSQSRMPGLWNHLPNQGAEMGTQSIVNDPMGYARVFVPGPAHFKANLPSPVTITRPGPPTVQNDLLRAASVPTLLNLSQQGTDALRGR